MRDGQNLRQLLDLKPDYVGFIFHPPSSRYVGDDFPQTIPAMVREAKKTGVFVNLTVENILSTVNRFQLDAIQLHGEETPEYCQSIKLSGIEIIKAFRIDSSFDFARVKPYQDVVDYFLFDTKTELYGGSGKKFDWSLLYQYNCAKPIFLSGGIGEMDLPDLLKLNHMPLYAIDLNSKFEIAPALKDIDKLNRFIADVRLSFHAEQNPS